jgi:hypothetical protein
MFINRSPCTYHRTDCKVCLPHGQPLLLIRRIVCPVAFPRNSSHHSPKMTVSQAFKVNMATLFVNQRMADAPTRGHPPVHDSVGTHIKQPLARPKIQESNCQQQMLANAAVASLKKRQGNIQSACNKMDETPKDMSQYQPKKSVDADDQIIKPSQIRQKNLFSNGY